MEREFEPLPPPHWVTGLTSSMASWRQEDHLTARVGPTLPQVSLLGGWSGTGYVLACAESVPCPLQSVPTWSCWATNSEMEGNCKSSWLTTGGWTPACSRAVRKQNRGALGCGGDWKKRILVTFSSLVWVLFSVCEKPSSLLMIHVLFCMYIIFNKRVKFQLGRRVILTRIEFSALPQETTKKPSVCSKQQSNWKEWLYRN